MFENIIAQEKTVDRISGEWREGNLPRAILFHGEHYSGKLSTALELARVLTCKERGAWSCSCSSCRKHRVLDHPYTIVTGARFLLEEISAAADTLLRTRRDGARYLFIRSVRKLTRRLDPLLWEGEEQKLKKAQSSREELEDALESIYPDVELPPEEKLKPLLEQIEGLTKKIFDVLPKDNIPINQIRSIGMWTHTTSADSAKVVIMENADRMSDGSKNALLKMLEEPPENTYFILLTAKRGAIIPTILSRLRQYRFVPRSRESAEQVMRKIFRMEDALPYEDLRAFFLAWRGVPVKALQQEAHDFIERIVTGEEWDVKEKAEFLKQRGTAGLFTPFLEELSFELQRRLGGRISSETLGKWNELIRETVRRWESYNMAPDVLLEALYYSMEETR